MGSRISKNEQMRGGTTEIGDFWVLRNHWFLTNEPEGQWQG